MTGLLLQGEREAFRRDLLVTTDVIGILEKMRREAGIFFTGELQE